MPERKDRELSTALSSSLSANSYSCLRSEETPMVSFFCQNPDPTCSTALPHPSGSEPVNTNYSLQSVVYY